MELRFCRLRCNSPSLNTCVFSIASSQSATVNGLLHCSRPHRSILLSILSTVWKLVKCCKITLIVGWDIYFRSIYCWEPSIQQLAILNNHLYCTGVDDTCFFISHCLKFQQIFSAWIQFFLFASQWKDNKRINIFPLISQSINHYTESLRLDPELSVQL